MKIPDKEVAEKILQHLKKTSQGFCYYQGLIVSEDECKQAIHKDICNFNACQNTATYYGVCETHSNTK